MSDAWVKCEILPHQTEWGVTKYDMTHDVEWGVNSPACIMRINSYTIA